MIGQLRAELLKLRSTRTTLSLFLSMVGLVAFAVALHLLTLPDSRLTSRSAQLDVFQVGTKIGMVFAALAGAMAITAEIRWGTIRPTFVVTPRRSPVLAAKVAVSALAGLVFGLLAEGLMVGSATIGFAARGIPIQLTGADYAQLVLGGAAAATAWAAIGLGIGALLRDQVASLVGLLAWVLLVETLLVGFLPHPSRFLPGIAGSELAGNRADLGAGYAALLLVLYAAAIVGIGWIATLRRDIA